MILKTILFMVGLILVFCSAGRAAKDNEALRLTLPLAVELALADNPDYLLSQNRQQAAATSVDAAKGRFLPSLQGSAGGTEYFRAQAAPGEDDAYQTADLQVTASLNLFNGFADSAGLDASQEEFQAADADLQRQRQTLIFSVASRFIEVVQNQELVQVSAQNLKSQQDLERQIGAFHRAGVRAVTDLYQQQATTAQAEFNLYDARRNLRVAKLQLTQVLGCPYPLEVEVLPPDPRGLLDAFGNLDPAQIFAQALNSRPDLRAQRRKIAAAQQQIQVAKAGYLPSLDLQAGAGTNYSSTSEIGFAGQLDDNRGGSLGLKLSIPIFDRDQTRTSVALAQISVADAATNLRKLQQQVALDVGEALADYQRTGQQLIAVGRQRDYAQQALAASEARYQVGAATWIETSTARAVFVQAQGDEVRARYAVLLQGLNIGYSRGDLEALLALLTAQESDL